MDWFLYDNGLRHERVKKYWILTFSLCLNKRSFSLKRKIDLGQVREPYTDFGDTD